MDESLRGSFSYAGGGYVLLQRLLEERTATPFAELMRDAILDPLDLRDSTFEQPLPERLYARVPRDDWRVYPEAAAAGLWTTPHELARAVSATQAARAGESSPLSRRVADWALEPQADVPAQPDFEAIRALGVEPPERAGLGAFLGGGGTRFGRLGGARGFTSAFDASTTDGNGAVVSDLQNGFGEVPPALAAAL